MEPQSSSFTQLLPVNEYTRIKKERKKEKKKNRSSSLPHRRTHAAAGQPQ
jgi:hypothetical protein